MVLPLSPDSLSALGRRLEIPGYDRSQLRPGIVHIGVGAFHRAHQAVYLDDLARAGETAWGEVGVGMHRPSMRDLLRAQAGLFTVIEAGAGQDRGRVIGVLTDYLYAPDDPAAVVRQLASPEVRLVTLTVTGDGYDGSAPAPDRCWLNYLVAALAARRRSGLGGFTVLSCDNLADSGGTARAAVLARARERDETLARWIEHHVTFPGSMVDRITPGSTPVARERAAHRFGVEDRGAVLTEPFTQWVVEDDFCQGRPPLEDAGVQLVSDVTPYKLVKSRMLNGVHSALSYLGTFAGHQSTAEVVQDPTMRAFVTTLMREEIAPLLPRVPGMDPDSYSRTVLERLGNREIADPLARLCARGSTKVPAYLLPSLLEARAAGRPTALLSLAVAAWIRYLSGTDLQGREIDVVDARREQLQPLARQARSDLGPLLAVGSIFGPAGGDLVLRRELRHALRELEHGVEHAVRHRLARHTRFADVVPRQRLATPSEVHR